MGGKTGADELLLGMENQALIYLNSLKNKNPFSLREHRFIMLLEWAESTTQHSTADLTPVAKRVLAKAVANAYANVNAYGNIYANAKAYTNAYAYIHPYGNAYANAYAYPYPYAIQNFITTIDNMEAASPLFSNLNLQKLRGKMEKIKTKIPNNTESRLVHKRFANQLLETWLNAFELTLDMINLSSNELREIDQNYFYVYNLMLNCKGAAELVTNETWAAIEERMYRVP